MMDSMKIKKKDEKVKMWVMLTQMDLDDALLGFEKMPSSWTDEDKRRDHNRCIVVEIGIVVYDEEPNKDTILYSHDTLTIDEVYDALFSKKKMKHLVNGLETQGDGLIVRERNLERNSGGDDRNRSKSRNRNKTCNYCKKGSYQIRVLEVTE
ncbi:hypothetical protein FXO37_35963 [Capsicum annuum]|nr:hypothetical protein FXO37_35963 [Capsicum annuum]